VFILSTNQEEQDIFLSPKARRTTSSTAYSSKVFDIIGGNAFIKANPSNMMTLASGSVSGIRVFILSTNQEEQDIFLSPKARPNAGDSKEKS
jgi:hypothetical protein